MDKKFLKKIIAQSPEDLQMISACCSEGKVKISDIKYLPSNKIFLISILRIQKGQNMENEQECVSFPERGFWRRLLRGSRARRHTVAPVAGMPSTERHTTRRGS